MFRGAGVEVQRSSQSWCSGALVHWCWCTSGVLMHWCSGGAVLQVQVQVQWCRCRYSVAGAGTVLQVQWCRYSVAGTVLQVPWCRCSGAGAIVVQVQIFRCADTI
jgi:hypothetical protein